MQILALDIFITFLQNPPSEDLLKKIKNEELWKNWFLKNNSPLQIEALELLSTKEDYKEICYDFTCLFISDIDFLKAPPYASFYLDKDREIYSCNSDRIKDIFLKNSFVNFLENEPADSLINELLFIKFLLLEDKKEVLKTFLESEFYTWFQIWNEDLKKGAKSNFYKGLALLLEDFFKTLL